MSVTSLGRLLTLFLGLSLLLLPQVLADDRAAEMVPEDTCILELTLPAGATVSIDGQAYGTKRRLTFDSLTPHEIYPKQLAIRYPSGKTSEHTILLEGGRRVRLARLDPKVQLPEFVTQRATAACGLPLCQFSPDEKRLLLYEGNAALCDVSTGRLLRIFRYSGPALLCTCSGMLGTAFLPKGNHLLYGSAIWDVETGQKLQSLEGDTKRDPSAVRVSPDGRYLLIGGGCEKGGYAALWDIANGRIVRTFEGHSSAVCSVTFDPEGQYALTCELQGLTILWDIESGRRLRSFAGKANCASFCDNGRQVLAGTCLWDVQNGRKLREFDGNAVVVGPDGKCILEGGFGWNGKAQPEDPGTAILWDVKGQKKLQTFTGHSKRVCSLAFRPDGTQVLTGAEDNTAILWNIATGKNLHTFHGTDPLGQAEVSFSPSGNRIVTVDMGGATIWNSMSGKPIARILPLAPLHDQLLVGPRGRLIACQRLTFGGDGGAVSVLDTASGQRVSVAGAGRPLCFSPDGRHLITRSLSNISTAIVWDAATAQNLQTLEGHSDLIQSAVFSQDGQQVLTGSRDKTAILWDTAEGRRLRTFDGFGSSVDSVAFTLDGLQILTQTGGGIVLWEANTGEKRRVFDGHGSADSVAFGPDGQHVLAGCWNGRAILWDTKNTHEPFTFGDIYKGGGVGHAQILAYGSDHIINTSCPDADVRLWSVKSRNLVRRFTGHSGEILSVQVDAATGILIAAGFDDQVLYWDLTTGLLLASVTFTQSGIIISTPEGLFDGSPEAITNICYRIGNGLNVVPVDRFYKDFYRPGLLAAIMRGERPLPEVEIGNQLPPKLQIVSPEHGTFDNRDVTVVAEVIDAGGGISNFGIFQNNARLLAEYETVHKGNMIRRTFHVRLVEGDNELTVKAACKDGSWESEPATVRLRYEKATPGAELYLVTAGVNHYADESLNLRFAAADAKSMAELFRQRGDALYGQGRVHVYTLLDDQVTKAGLQKTLAEVAQKAQSQDTLILALSGHGTMLGSLYYFVPHELRCRSGKPVEQEIREQGLPQHQLQDWISRVPALKRVLILDTCQSGGAVGLGRTGRSPWQFKKAMESLSRNEGTYIIAAAAASDEAQEVPDLGHGVLTYALLAGAGATDAGPLGRKAIKPESDNRLMTVGQWLRYAQEKVPSLTKLYFDHQQFIEAEIKGQDFPILPFESHGAR